MSIPELVATAAAEARDGGWDRPDVDNIVGYYRRALDALGLAFDLVVVAEFALTDRKARRAARQWGLALAKALRDLGEERAVVLYRAGADRRQEAAREASERTWDAVGRWNEATLDGEIVLLVTRVRMEAALVGEEGPTYKRASKLVGTTGWLLALPRATCDPGRARDPRTRDGIARDALAGAADPLAREEQIEREREIEREVPRGASRATRPSRVPPEGDRGQEPGDVVGTEAWEEAVDDAYADDGDGWVE